MRPTPEQSQQPWSLEEAQERCFEAPSCIPKDDHGDEVIGNGRSKVNGEPEFCILLGHEGVVPYLSVGDIG